MVSSVITYNSGVLTTGSASGYALRKIFMPGRASLTVRGDLSGGAIKIYKHKVGEPENINDLIAGPFYSSQTYILNLAGDDSGNTEIFASYEGTSGSGQAIIEQSWADQKV